MNRWIAIAIIALLVGCNSAPRGESLEHLYGTAENLSANIVAVSADVKDAATKIGQHAGAAMAAGVSALAGQHIAAIRVLSGQLVAMESRFGMMQAGVATIMADTETAKAERARLIEQIHELKGEFRRRMDRYAAWFLLAGVVGVGALLFLKQISWAVSIGSAAGVGIILTRIANAVDRAIPGVALAFVAAFVLAMLYIVGETLVRWNQHKAQGFWASLKQSLYTDPISDVRELLKGKGAKGRRV